MKCPNNHESFQEIKFGNVKVDRCSECEGLWFNHDELRQAKDVQDEYAKWFDVDLWKDEKDFKSTSSTKLCPIDNVPLYEIDYGNSGVKIDACKTCQGIWLDKDEFKHLIDYIKKSYPYDLAFNYTKSILEEGKEIFTGPESLKSEITDFLLLVKLVQFKVFISPTLTNVILNLPLTK
ncbi:MAG: hypothetical protein A3I07_00800 [Candidatus Doudnabacteria bacterium RIFCSPLOWO2_02_FULL_42_9]|uniref:Transcription factor zinc-finger domain-containing protein n=1 Tax=Candidatus Doudnabacteria bacterium RIFCSPHIGHO2_01_FULL_41_86 TaxID=1817821 RepID=A0A1F5N9R5_9BACT|nr:MAG: hypothetical protein A2717_02810 [Candidatus Doudnabacteria bacterium RIFCSPHIGHO2_01_FULL_41_86]OGE75523.1 MAG: hypothetical protein A3K07_01140 [Candidatus Doudnabacteria bacterium RIFCSPHIGHO2_01_43_10]OGE85480.1 MAG: hypothetical protein A3E28_02380 [Candidatus Doudnabacteria bacterium RIFCSPHIGHO2_12_FULL_42_22]OGE87018.1 MAG: hypothetical protein A3C49_03215 [Candidatus Doudnabacteria bacterium RIFCSPHIGHO2_02_FULL_42_25]OGE92617.1 MAG: hypothetical protein A2895_03370 [Candidatus